MRRASQCCIDVLISIFVFGFSGTVQQVSPCSAACTLTSCGAGPGVESSIVRSCGTDVEGRAGRSG